jgi:outer membrane scaffolding protein for murein synthesis (MipA/OmpV family)
VAGALSVLALGICAMTSASAQDTAAAASSPPRWAVGLAAGLSQRVYRDFNSQARALPLLVYENDWVHVFGPGVDVKLPSLGPVSFRLRGRYIGEGYESTDSPFLAGMDDRDGSFWAGGVLSWRTDIATVSAEVLADTMGHSKGTRAKLQLERRFAAGAFGFTPRLAAEWVDRKYVRYYYGVTAAEATPLRPAYAAVSTLNTELALRIDWRLSPKNAVFLDIGATRMGAAVTRSPLVGQETQAGVGLGYFHRF